MTSSNNPSNGPIAILDSGVGGLSIFECIVRLLPDEDYIYFADSGFCPYSAQSVEKIQERTAKIVRFFIDQGAKLIVLACNTATVSALGYLRSIFDVPIVGVVPVVKTAANLTRSGKIGVIATSVTLKSPYHADLIANFAAGATVYNQPCPGLVEAIEEGEIENCRRILKESLDPLIKKGIDILALGCTHYPLIRSEIEAVAGPDIEVLDSGEAVANQVKRVLVANNDLGGSTAGRCRFFISSDNGNFKEALERYFNINIPTPEITPGFVLT